MYTWDNYFGKLAQTIGFGVQSGTMYFVNDGYASDRWGNFYKLLTQYRVAEKTWEAEDEETQKVDRIFLALTEVFLYDHLSQMVDIWGPIPFTKAGFLGVTSDIADAYPAYDTDVDLYKMMLENLDALYTEIGAYKANMTDLAKTKLEQQDFINGGDLDKWLVYANALRLRLGVHVAAQGALTAEGKAAVASAAKRALPTDWESSIKVASDFDGFQYWENFRDGYKDINNVANQKMIDAMQVAGENDPRLPVIYIPNEAGDFYGEYITETSDEQNEHNTYNEYEERYYAHLNGATFTSWMIVKGLTLKGNIATDYTTQKQENKEYAGTNTALAGSYQGYYGIAHRQYTTIYGDALLNWDYDLTDDLNLTTNVGWSARREMYSASSTGTNGGLTVENWFNLAASAQKANSGMGYSDFLKQAYFGTLALSYKNWAYLEGTLRQERTSTLKQAYWYPSVNASIIFSDLLNLPSWVDYGKFRVSYGEVGNAPALYKAPLSYSQSSASGYVYNQLGMSAGNDAIRPERTKEWELGLEGKWASMSS